MKRAIEELNALYMEVIKAGQSSLPFPDERIPPTGDKQSSLPISDEPDPLDKG